MPRSQSIIGKPTSASPLQHYPNVADRKSPFDMMKGLNQTAKIGSQRLSLDPNNSQMKNRMTFNMAINGNNSRRSNSQLGNKAPPYRVTQS